VVYLPSFLTWTFDSGPITRPGKKVAVSWKHGLQDGSQARAAEGTGLLAVHLDCTIHRHTSVMFLLISLLEEDTVSVLMETSYQYTVLH